MIIHLSRPHLVQEYVEQFQELAVAYRLDRLVLVDPGHHAAGIRNIRPGRIQFARAASTAEALRITVGVPVFLEEGQPFTLHTFQHPADAVYVIGDDVDGLQVPSGAISVTIETGTPGHLWSQQAAAIVLHDRHIKVGCC
jgi:hypothetical protein